MIALLVVIYAAIWLWSWLRFYIDMVAEGGVDLEILDVAVPLGITLLLSAIWPIMWPAIILRRRVLSTREVP